MKLQRTTLALLGIAIVLGGIVYVSERQRTQNQETPQTTKQPIFSFKEDDIQSVTIYMGEETFEFQRVNGQTTNWRMKQPQDAPASDAAVAFLLDLLAEGKSTRSFPIRVSQFSEFGLDKPMATVKVQLNNKADHWLILGKPDFNRSSLYAQADPSYQTPQPPQVLLVPIDFEYAVNRPLSEWIVKPEKAATPKTSPTPEGSPPSPTPTESKPSPTPEKPSPTAQTTPLNFPLPGSTPVTGNIQPQASPTPTDSKPSPTPEKPKPSPKAQTTPLEFTLPASTPVSGNIQPQASPTPTESKPSPTPEKPSPTAQTTPLNFPLPGSTPVSGSIQPQASPTSPNSNSL
jgi:hypothetical protein